MTRLEVDYRAVEFAALILQKVDEMMHDPTKSLVVAP